MCVVGFIFSPVHCFALITAELHLPVYHPVTQGSETALPQHLSSVCVCTATAEQLSCNIITEKSKNVQSKHCLFALYLKSSLYRSGYRNNNCTNEKFLQERRLPFTFCKISVPVVPLHTLLHKQVDHGAELFPLGAWRCREAHAPSGMSVVSKSGLWGSGKYGEEPREGFQHLKGLQESWRGIFIKGMEW